MRRHPTERPEKLTLTPGRSRQPNSQTTPVGKDNPTAKMSLSPHLFQNIPQEVWN